jgi:hypothetical protein
MTSYIRRCQGWHVRAQNAAYSMPIQAEADNSDGSVSRYDFFPFSARYLRGAREGTVAVTSPKDPGLDRVRTRHVLAARRAAAFGGAEETALDHDPLDLIEAHLVAPAIVELHRAGGRNLRTFGVGHIAECRGRVARCFVLAITAPRFNPPRRRQGCPGKIFLQGRLVSDFRETIPVVLRGVDPRIHVFVSTASRRGWPGLSHGCPVRQNRL